MDVNSTSMLRDGIDAESYMATPLWIDPQPGGNAPKRAPRQHATLNVLLRMPGIYDTRGLRAVAASNPSGTPDATDNIAFPAPWRAALLRLLSRLQVPIEDLLAVPVQ